jgi:hypothetical protein
VSQLRLALSVIGLVIAVGGVIRDDRRLVWAAIALIGASIVLRIIVRRREG